MSILTYIASDHPLEERPNPHERLVSVNEALALGKTNIHDFLLAPDFDRDKPGVLLWADRDVVFDITHGEIRDGALDDDFALLNTDGADSIFTEKNTLYAWSGIITQRAVHRWSLTISVKIYSALMRWNCGISGWDQPKNR